MPELVAISLPSTATEWVALVGGVVGGVLGIRAEWRAIRSERPRLRVIPQVAFSPPYSDTPPVMLCVEVINVGSLAVTIDEVGFTLSGGRDRLPIERPCISLSPRLPIRLEAHSGETFFMDPYHVPPTAWARLGCAYARTATDKTFKGSSRALKKVSQAGRVPAKPPLPISSHGVTSTPNLDEWEPEDDDDVR